MKGGDDIGKETKQAGQEADRETVQTGGGQAAFEVREETKMRTAYAEFKGATRKHGHSITRDLRQWLKEQRARTRRRKRRKAVKALHRRARPKHSPRRGWSGRMYSRKRRKGAQPK